MRKRTVTMDGAEFVVSPLTVEQTEEHLEALEKITGGATTVDVGSNPEMISKLKKSSQRLVATGLNNAHIESWNGETPVYESGFSLWTSERVARELDLGALQELRGAIMEMSRLKAATEGEAGAVS